MGAIKMTDRDYERLSTLVGAMRGGPRSGYAAMLGERLREASTLDDEAFDSGCVKMGSSASLLDLGTEKEFRYRLAFPGEADIEAGKISVLSPLGAALLGRTRGEEFSYQSPGGPVRMRVLEVDTES